MADLENSKLRLPTLWVIAGLIATAVWWQASFVSDTRRAVEMIQRTIEHDRVEMVDAIREVRDEVRRIVVDSVAVRQANAWLETWQLVLDAWLESLRVQNATLKVPAVKVPPLPR